MVGEFACHWRHPRLPWIPAPYRGTGRACDCRNDEWRGPLAPAHQGMKRRSCGLVRRIGAADSATPLLRPSGGQAPALHSPLPTPLDSGFRRNDDPGDSWDSEPLSKPSNTIFVPMRKSVAGVYPGSESRTCFHTNRPCRLPPAHQGVKSWSCGLVRRIGAADSATPLLRPSGGQAPALHSPLPTPLDSGFRRNDDPGDSWDSEALSKRRNIILVPMTKWAVGNDEG